MPIKKIVKKKGNKVYMYLPYFPFLILCICFCGFKIPCSFISLLNYNTALTDLLCAPIVK